MLPSFCNQKELPMLRQWSQNDNEDSAMTEKKGQKCRYWPRIRSERLKTKQKDISRFDSRPAPDENESYKSQKFFSKSSRGNECCPSYLFPRWTADDTARILYIFFRQFFLPPYSAAWFEPTSAELHRTSGTFGRTLYWLSSTES